MGGGDGGHGDAGGGEEEGSEEGGDGGEAHVLIVGGGRKLGIGYVVFVSVRERILGWREGNFGAFWVGCKRLARRGVRNLI